MSDNITGAELFELFCQATPAEIAQISLEDMTTQIGELREDWKNEPSAPRLAHLSDEQIAQAILDYATQ